MVSEYNFQNAIVAVRKTIFHFLIVGFPQPGDVQSHFHEAFYLFWMLRVDFFPLAVSWLVVIGLVWGSRPQQTLCIIPWKKCSAHRSSLSLVKIFSVSHLQICLCFCSFCKQDHCFFIVACSLGILVFAASLFSCYMTQDFTTTTDPLKILVLPWQCPFSELPTLHGWEVLLILSLEIFPGKLSFT